MSLPELFGTYLLHDRLARGATSEVFLAQTTGEYPRLCAVKRIRPQLAALPEFLERFREDAKLLVRLIHGNLVQVLEVGAVEEQPFVAMEPIDGVEHRELLASVARSGPLPPEAALYVGLEMCEALSYLRARRAEQPADAPDENGARAARNPADSYDRAWPLEVMIAFDGVVKLIDLGASGALRLGQQKVSRLFRSPGYAIPEVILKQPLDARSDIFALGVVVWELLAGRRLVADEPESYVRDVLGGSWKAPPIERQDVPGSVLRVVAEMLRLDPDRRPLDLDRARRPLVDGLRRMAPTYGSASLSRLVRHRCRARARELRRLTRELLHRTRTAQSPTPFGSTMSYGLAGSVERRVAKPAELQLGDRIPGTRYRLVRKLGRGGSAEVFCAQHIDLDRQVALKVLDPGLAAQAGAITQFRLEARACSRIGHPNIVDVIDFGELDDGRFFFVMELVEGESLAEVLGRERTLSPERALPIFRQISKALAAAHEHNIIHRDLKPENVMLGRRDGRSDFVKVLDFGVMAFSSDTRSVRVGTPGYMAPEQVDGHAPAPQMDVYGVGATLYEVLGGTLPYPGLTFDEFIAQQAVGPPPRLRTLPGAERIPAPIERVVHRALERDPQSRHSSMAEFERDLLRAQRQAGITTAWDDLAAPELPDEGRSTVVGRDDRRRRARRSRLRPWAAGVFAAGVLGAALVGGLLAVRSRRATEVASSGAGANADVGRAAAAEPGRPATIERAGRPTPPGPNAGRSAGPGSSEPARGGGASEGKSASPGRADKRTRRTAAVQKASARPASAKESRRREATAARGAGPKSGRDKSAAPATDKTHAVSRRDPRRARALIAQGRRLLPLGKLPEARRRFRDALAADPQSAAALAGLASVAFAAGRYEDAVRHARLAIRRDRRMLEAHLVLGDSYFKLARHADARAAWKRVLALRPDDPRAKRRLARLSSD